MKQISYKDIKDLGPCYDPIKYIPVDWSGTLVDILKMSEVSAKDRLWVCVREQFMSDRQLHLYGLACARSCEHLSGDNRVKECNDVVERYLNGEATKEELSAAESAAARSARSAWSAWSAWSAAWSARSAAESAWSAAWSAVESAARSAAASAAWSAVRSAVEQKQCEMLIEILEEK